MSKPPAFRLIPAFLGADEITALVALAEAQPRERWLPGRQGTGYWKCSLRGEPGALIEDLTRRSLSALGVEGEDWDSYLLRYEAGSSVPEHRDPAARPHRRLNALIEPGRRPEDPAGVGALRIDGAALPLEIGDALVFRPDLATHSVAPVSRRRLVWSVGVLDQSL